VCGLSNAWIDFEDQNMDPKNRLHTAGTYRLMRAEHLALLALSLALGIYHWESVDWTRAFLAFWVIDVFGYLPGAIAYRRKGGGPISPIYHHIYNFAHTYLVAGAGVGLWALASGGLEWAMLAIPVHLSIDRGIFGNVFKPVELPFEPVAAPLHVVALALGRARKIDENDAASSPTALSREIRSSAPAVVNHPSGFLALNSTNRIFTVPGHPGFIAYREQGKHLVLFGGIHAPEDSWEAILDGFSAEAIRRRRRVMAVQVRESQVGLFAARGFTVNSFGSSFSLALEGFSLAGKKKMKLRNKIQRARRSGVRVVEIGQDIPRDEAAFASLGEVSAEWLDGKGAKEIDFLIGEIGGPEDADRRIFAALSEAGSVLGFISYVPVWGERPGYLHDLTRKRPKAPAGTMELVNSTAIERFRAEGAGYLHFGFTPFIVDGFEPPAASKAVAWVVRKLREHGEALYPAASQAAYKLKWEPDVVEREYVAVKPLSLRGIVDLLLVTRTV
jgi:lysylphosphatidylglycerol synthetase-like protein (DUF2156 family)